jgi:hypothetical protein
MKKKKKKRGEEKEKREEGGYLRIEMPVQENHLIEILEIETNSTNWKHS